ncbi:hypothetical protein [Cellulomonas marina]|uniref:Uncharacterized protein n=1 Tax=Cellulomonas marina TaxID=988821 RepID=A0A1I0Z4I1_9CELL|nr:hypothetical protein [Cellulomonas marina]GIG28180.1 hypothetical protein Cma02nite_07800 [Cellulomonas marina]SFB19500.1 hypothetical protein SAMN05421867_109120 [Cellulomonas marina]
MTGLVIATVLIGAVLAVMAVGMWRFRAEVEQDDRRAAAKDPTSYQNHARWKDMPASSRLALVLTVVLALPGFAVRAVDDPPWWLFALIGAAVVSMVSFVLLERRRARRQGLSWPR